METSQEKYRKIKQFGLSQGLPKIPPYLYSKLKQAYNQYLQLAGIFVGKFDEVKIQEHREKYKHLYSGLRQGSPIFDNKNCVDYMNLISGIPKKYCACYVYLDYVQIVASGLVVLGEDTWKESIENELSFTKEIIEEEKETQQKTQKKKPDSKNTKPTNYESIFGITGSGKTISSASLLSQNKEIKITYKKTDD